jgi:tol-pal system protein YbgF
VKRLSAIYICLFFLLSIFGCATSSDVRRVEQGFDRKLASLKEDNAKLLKELAEAKKSTNALQKNQAESGADLIELRDNVQKLRGAMDELRKELAGLRAERKEKDAKINELSLRIHFLENYIGIGKKGDISESVFSDRPAVAGGSKDGIYSSAQRAFKEGRYEDSRRDFQKYLELYPKAEYADNAQFWISESYYVDGKFEKAILEYEKLLKAYPSSDKVPAAMMKQAFSFLKIGDKSSAKLLLQQVIKDYPDTNQARMARTRLQEIR